MSLSIVRLSKGASTVEFNAAVQVTQNVTSDIRFRKRKASIVARDRQKWENKYSIRGRVEGPLASILITKFNLLNLFKSPGSGVSLQWRYKTSVEPIVTGNGTTTSGFDGVVNGFITKLQFEDNADNEGWLSFVVEFMEAKLR